MRRLDYRLLALIGLSYLVGGCPNNTPSAALKARTIEGPPLTLSGTVTIGGTPLAVLASSQLTSADPLTNASPLTSSSPLTSAAALTSASPLTGASPLISASPLTSSAPYRVESTADSDRVQSASSVVFVEAIDTATGNVLARVKADATGHYSLGLYSGSTLQGVVIQATAVQGSTVEGFLAAPAPIAAKASGTQTVDVTPASTTLAFSDCLLSGVEGSGGPQFNVATGFRGFKSDGLADLVALTSPTQIQAFAASTGGASAFSSSQGVESVLSAAAQTGGTLAQKAVAASSQVASTVEAVAAAQNVILGAVAPTSGSSSNLQTAIDTAASAVTASQIQAQENSLSQELALAPVPSAVQATPAPPAAPPTLPAYASGGTQLALKSFVSDGQMIFGSFDNPASPAQTFEVQAQAALAGPGMPWLAIDLPDGTVGTQAYQAGPGLSVQSSPTDLYLTYDGRMISSPVLPSGGAADILWYDGFEALGVASSSSPTSLQLDTLPGSGAWAQAFGSGIGTVTSAAYDVQTPQCWLAFQPQNAPPQLVHVNLGGGTMIPAVIPQTASFLQVVGTQDGSTGTNQARAYAVIQFPGQPPALYPLDGGSLGPSYVLPFTQTALTSIPYQYYAASDGTFLYLARNDSPTVYRQMLPVSSTDWQTVATAQANVQGLAIDRSTGKLFVESNGSVVVLPL